MDKQQLVDRLSRHGQQHLLAFWDELSASQRSALAEQIAEIDFAALERLVQEGGQREDWDALAARARSPEAFSLDGAGNACTAAEGRRRGEEALAAGRVGAILVAGGQGTRLGFDQPKGMYAIGPVSHATLLRILVEKLLAACRRYAVRIPLYLMTSPATHEPTLEYFATHDRLGLADDQLHVFCQATMPAVDAASGRVLLADKGRVAVSPDGHGGMLAALVRSGLLADMGRRGLEQLFYFQVDNPLVDVCDAEFIGYHLHSGAEVSTQVVRKQEPGERVGVVVEVDGRARIIEYSDLPEEAAARRAPDGTLALWAGSIAVHVFDRAFLERASQQADTLPWHRARKKVPSIDERGRPFEPREPNAIKFERFIFDLLPAARKSIVMEVDPATDFAPLKNAPGAQRDSPEWVQRQMLALHRRWLRSAGAVVADEVPVEISPLFALDEAEVCRKVAAGTRFERATYLGP